MKVVGVTAWGRGGSLSFLTLANGPCIEAKCNGGKIVPFPLFSSLAGRAKLEFHGRLAHNHPYVTFHKLSRVGVMIESYLSSFSFMFVLALRTRMLA